MVFSNDLYFMYRKTSSYPKPGATWEKGGNKTLIRYGVPGHVG